MESTTLVTFMLQHPSARKVELLGSWDNFGEAYAMAQDRRRGRGHWSGCHSFRNIICDGDDTGIHEKRAGGLKMGGTYWYFYRIDDDEEFHDPSQETTTACPLMPGQTLNVLEVPFDVERFGSHSRSSSSVSLVSAVKTLNPEDRYVNPRPVTKPQLPKLITSAEAAASARHLFAAPSANADRNSRKRPRSAGTPGAHGWHGWSRSAAQRKCKSASSSPANAANILKAAFSLQLNGPAEALTPSEGGRGRSRTLHSDRLRTGRSKTPGSRKLRRQMARPATVDSPTEILGMRSHAEMAIAQEQPLVVRNRMGSSHLSVRRVQEANMSSKILDQFPAPPERGRTAASIVDFSRLGRPSHRRGFSDSFSSRRSSLSIARKREPSPLRNLAMSQEDTAAVDELAIPTCVPEAATEDLQSPKKAADAFAITSSSPTSAARTVSSQNRSALDDYQLSHRPPPPPPPPLQSHSTDLNEELSAQSSYAALPEPGFFDEESDEMQLALQALHEQYASDRHYLPWRPEFDIRHPESPETSHDAGSDIGSSTFSSIQGDASDTCTSHRLSDLRDWPLKANEFSGFDFAFENDGPDPNQSFEHLSIRTTGTESTTSTAMPYQLPNTNPFAQSKTSIEQPQQRGLTQMEQLFDEFEYLGAAVL